MKKPVLIGIISGVVILAAIVIIILVTKNSNNESESGNIDGENSNQEDINTLNGENNNILKGEGNGYRGDLNINFTFPLKKTSGSANVRGISINQSKNKLQSQIKLDSLTFNASDGYSNSNLNANGIDIITVYENIYFKGQIDGQSGYGEAFSINSLGNINQGFSKIAEIINSGNYVNINKSKDYLDELIGLSSTKLGLTALKAVGTSNPLAYLKENDFWLDLGSTFLNNNSHKIIFNEIGNKNGITELELNEDICNLFETSKGKEQILGCIDTIQEFNQSLNGNLTLTNSGDQSIINYDGGEMANLNYSYGNGKLNKLDFTSIIGNISYSNNKLITNISTGAIPFNTEDLKISTDLDFSENFDGNIKISYKGSLGNGLIDGNFNQGSLETLGGQIDIKSPFINLKSKLSIGEGLVDVLVQGSYAMLFGPKTNFKLLIVQKDGKTKGQLIHGQDQIQLIASKIKEKNHDFNLKLLSGKQLIQSIGGNIGFNDRGIDSFDIKGEGEHSIVGKYENNEISLSLDKEDKRNKIEINGTASLERTNLIINKGEFISYEIFNVMDLSNSISFNGSLKVLVSGTEASQKTIAQEYNFNGNFMPINSQIIPPVVYETISMGQLEQLLQR